MGVSIHYRGTLNDLALYPKLKDELIDIAKSMGWECNVFDEDWSIEPNASLEHKDGCACIEGELGLKGVLLVPDVDCESIPFLFDKHGHLRCLMGMIRICEGSADLEELCVSVKTQFGGPDIHIWVIGLLKYVSRNYISNLEVFDEAEYWEKGDRKLVEEKIAFLNEKMDSLVSRLSITQWEDTSELTADEIADRIESLFEEDYE